MADQLFVHLSQSKQDGEALALRGDIILMVKESTQKQTAAVGSWNVPESISEPVSASFTGVNLEWDQRSSKISPGLSLCNWDQNSAQVKLRKNPTEAICLEHAPCSVSSVPTTHKTKRKVSKPQHRKKCPPGHIRTGLRSSCCCFP